MITRVCCTLKALKQVLLKDVNSSLQLVRALLKSQGKAMGKAQDGHAGYHGWPPSDGIAAFHQKPP